MPPKPRKAKTAATLAPVPQTRDEATAAVREIGERQRELARIQADMNEELAAVRERFEAAAQPHTERIDQLTLGVQVWADAHRATLTQGGKTKTAVLPSGEIAWRIRPPSCRIIGAEAVMDELRRLQLARFIRTKSEINKEAILNEPEAVAHIKGIRIEQGEDFIVSPFEVELADAGV